MKERLSVIKEKLKKLSAQDKDLEVFEAGTHQYQLKDKISEKELSAFEKKHQVSLPEEYRLFLTELGNGGAGPYYGLHDLEKGLEEAILYSNDENEKPATPLAIDFPFSNKAAADYIQAYMAAKAAGDEDLVEPLELPDTLTGVIFLCEYGCGWSYCLVVKGEQQGTVWFHGENMQPCFKGDKQLGFFDWYENWLDDSIASFSNEEDEKEPYDEHAIVVDLTGRELKKLPEGIGAAVNLKKLILSNNDLKVFPEIITSFSQLRTLDLSMNPAKKIPASIGQLKNLKRLSINYGYITALPEEFARLQKLESLEMYYAYEMKQLPDVVTGLANLKTLRLSNCYELKKLPEDIGQLAELELLYLNDNANLETLPVSIVELKKLKVLYLDNTKIKSLPPGFEQLENLETLGIAAEGLDLDSVIQQISQLPKLQTLKIKMQREYPVRMSLLNNVRSLTIEQNYSLNENEQMALPENICRIPNLEKLDLMNNNQVLALPETIGFMEHLKEIEIGATSIKTFPESMKALKNLVCVRGSLNSGESGDIFGVLPAEKEKLQGWHPGAKIWIW